MNSVIERHFLTILNEVHSFQNYNCTPMFLIIVIIIYLR